MANDGTALGALNEIIENAGGASDAQTLVPAIEQLGEIIGSGGGGGTVDYNVRLIAANAQTAQVLTQVGMKVSATYSPAQMAEDKRYLDSRNRLCWTFDDDSGNTALECAALSFLGNLGDRTFALIARGSTSLAYGVLGAGDSWIIEANA